MLPREAKQHILNTLSISPSSFLTKVCTFFMLNTFLQMLNQLYIVPVVVYACLHQSTQRIHILTYWRGKTKLFYSFFVAWKRFWVAENPEHRSIHHILQQQVAMAKKKRRINRTKRNCIACSVFVRCFHDHRLFKRRTIEQAIVTIDCYGLIQ